MDRTTTGYRLAGTETFRLSSKALLKFPPEQRGYGGNLQNIDKDKVGEIYIPDEGKIFLKVDQSGAEALIVAYLCRNAKYRSLFTNGIKPHIYMALRLFEPFWSHIFSSTVIKEFLTAPIADLPLLPKWKEVSSAIKNDKMKYYVGKKTIHSASYGVKAPTLQMSILLDTEGTLSPSIGECRDWLGTFHDTFPEIEEWHGEVRDKITKYRRLENLFGYPRLFHQPAGDDLWKSGYAFPAQSTVACITHKAVVFLQNSIEKDKLAIDLLQNEHDGILVQCPNDEGYILQTALVCKEAMEQELTSPRGEKFRMKAEVSIGKNLKEMKDYETTNPS